MGAPIFKPHSAFQWDQSNAPDYANADAAAATRCGYTLV